MDDHPRAGHLPAPGKRKVGLQGRAASAQIVEHDVAEGEDQADRVGLRYVYEAGFDPTKGPGLWENFKQKYGEEDKLTNFFTGDHSRPTERIRSIQRQLAIVSQFQN